MSELEKLYKNIPGLMPLVLKKVIFEVELMVVQLCHNTFMDVRIIEKPLEVKLMDCFPISKMIQKYPWSNAYGFE